MLRVEPGILLCGSSSDPKLKYIKNLKPNRVYLFHDILKEHIED